MRPVNPPPRSLHCRRTVALAARPSHRRPRAPAAASAPTFDDDGTPPPPSAHAEAAAKAAFARIDELMAEVAREVWVDTQVEDVMAAQLAALLGGQPRDDEPAAPPPPTSQEDIEAAAIARVAASRVAGADNALLAALGIAASAAADAGDAANARRLGALRSALVDAVSDGLPPEARVLDAAVRASTPTHREAVIEAALTTGRLPPRRVPDVDGDNESTGGDDDDARARAPATTLLPRVTAAALYSVATQVIDDVESHQLVPDRAMLARLVLAREDVRAVADCGRLADAADAASLADAVAAHSSVLHSGAAQVARAVVAAGTAAARRALLAEALSGESEEAAGTADAPPVIQITRLAPRPGRVLTALDALAAGLRDRGDAARAQLLAAARADAVALLTEAGYGEGRPLGA